MKKKPTSGCRSYKGFLNASREYTDGQLIDWALDNNYDDEQFVDDFMSYTAEVEVGSIDDGATPFEEYICGLSDKQRYEIFRYMTEPDYCGIAHDSIYHNRGDID